MSPTASPSRHKAGHRLVVVVSAMSGETDRLLKLAREVNPDAAAREIDVLLSTGEQQTIALTALALHGLGVPAVSLTGAQAGIVTDGVHTKAKITNITPKKVLEHLDAGHVVIVAGFQGQNEMATSPRWAAAGPTSPPSRWQPR